MLAEFKVINFGLMEEVTLTFSKGLIAFTGETGAGKSMLIDALGVLLGGRANADFIRHGVDQARLEGIFTDIPPSVSTCLENEGFALEEGQLFLYRELNSSGRNVCRIQGRTVPLSTYRGFCIDLVDIHGQMEHLSLFKAENHRDLLDSLGGLAQRELLKQVSLAARTCRSLIQQERRLNLSVAERKQKEEFLRFQIDEIDQVNPICGETESLEQEKQRLLNAERIMNLLVGVYEDLYNSSANRLSTLDLLGSILKSCHELARLDSECIDFVGLAESLYYATEDFAEQIRFYQEKFEFEPGRLEQIEERQSQLYRLRKYGTDMEDILTAREQLYQELEEIDNLEQQTQTLTKEIGEAKQEYLKLAKVLSQNRQKLAGRLEKELLGELAELGLEQSQVKVRRQELAEPAEYGAEEIEFYFSANLGEPPKPLAKVASGGEMSRLMLALKTILAQVEKVDTFIFDEVDSGVGGRIIRKVAEKLVGISRDKQVLCITHNALVAAHAAEHFGISKEIDNQRTYTRVQSLNKEERIEELARMLGGGTKEIIMEHAKELLSSVKKVE
ncbi:MAG: DNA repair protein RecN [Desulfitobacteriaceae bacterium]|nr:DNA repair protein RecN [Desulfitobacteriaceae bacterium]MDD4346128.1 DNA repair protein RecN [Desulfitobacteriaceae bacterium]MDD4401088.1 DNA repair protein RecN [Desulfitobacteriaceae bacterium]